ncbi:YkvA family protein [Clostridium weizhouense]|uniref:DUF1232 domain-containing protein n=1 Tax=Clostridium weizhouense TaxID=2859781 RepID=A0ABS7AJ02_9CLOT|nr:DUF1232 domain-containing protein [Clostridium weizhouense]MBW6408653.1 DUF1232 domain-containing protein [Clostridium weizhouense]
MRVSSAKVKLVGEDILSIINEFVKIDGLSLNKVIISDGILIYGNFKKGLNVDFSLKVNILECSNGNIIGKLSNLKVMKLGLFRMIRSLILKKLIKEFNDKGIIADRDKVIIDIKKVLKDVPFVDIDLHDVFIKKDELWVELENINVSLKGELIKEINEEDKVKNIEESKEIITTNKVKDNYSKGREFLVNNLPEKSKNFKDYIFLLPDIISLIYRLLKDERVPLKTKVILSSSIAYIVFPTDIIPNNIPFIGVIDELGVAFFALNSVVNDVPMNVIVENWEGKNNILLVLKGGLEYLINFTGAKNVEKLYQVINEMSTL